MTPFIRSPPLLGRGLVRRSCSGGGRARGAGLPVALELPHVGHDRPPVRGRDWPAIPGHQPYPVCDDVEDLPVRVLQNLLLMEGGGGDVAALEQDPPAVPTSVVARLAIDPKALATALDERVVHGMRNRRDELSVSSSSREEGRV